MTQPYISPSQNSPPHQEPLLSTLNVIDQFLNALLIMPLLQIHQHIADFLPDTDVVNYACICEVTRASITNIVWKHRFDRTFDSVPGATIGDVVAKYKSRQAVSKKWTCFDLGQWGGQINDECRWVQKENQQDCLKMLRCLILGEPVASFTPRRQYLHNSCRVECPQNPR
jgi:hypothetical protein